MKEIGLYIHIPFCKSKCYYCDFISFANKETCQKEYIEAVIKEIRHADLRKYNISTVYIGGGTPSILDSKYIARIINEIKSVGVTSSHPCFEEHAIANVGAGIARPNTEITIEINPGTVDREKLQIYKEAGINRLSIGLQSTDDTLLKEIGRIHKYEDFLKVFNEAREVGFKNINVDLMLGLPNQTIEILEDSVKKVIELNPEHISIYSLILEEGTKLYDMVKSERLTLPGEELERKMYWKVKEMLEKSGYIHYEISNFAKEGYVSKHNSDCWKQKEYIGIGAAAHSYLNDTRYSNKESLEEYVSNINDDSFDKNIIVHERQTIEGKQKEYMLLGLRKLEGVSIREFKKKFGQNPIFIYHTELEKLVNEELLEVDGDDIRLTDKGLDLANLVWEEFV